MIDDFLLAPRPVGDDEQYAAAMALLANRVGVPARVVVGAVRPPRRQGAGVGRARVGRAPRRRRHLADVAHPQVHRRPATAAHDDPCGVAVGATDRTGARDGSGPTARGAASWPCPATRPPTVAEPSCGGFPGCSSCCWLSWSPRPSRVDSSRVVTPAGRRTRWRGRGRRWSTTRTTSGCPCSSAPPGRRRPARSRAPTTSPGGWTTVSSRPTSRAEPTSTRRGGAPTPSGGRSAGRRSRGDARGPSSTPRAWSVHNAPAARGAADYGASDDEPGRRRAVLRYYDQRSMVDRPSSPRQ